MAIGTTEIKTVGRAIFELIRGEDTTTRTIDIPYPKTDSENLQSVVDELNTKFTVANPILIQPANWRDSNTAEEQWTTVGFRYEIVTTSTTPITPTGADSLTAIHHDEQREYHDEQQG